MLSKTEAADLLTKVSLFGTLDASGRAAVADALRETNFDAGQVIFARGDAGAELYIVAKGRVRLSVLTADGKELSFAHAEAPAVFGELAVFDGRPRSADATAPRSSAAWSAATASSGSAGSLTAGTVGALLRSIKLGRSWVIEDTSSARALGR